MFCHRLRALRGYHNLTQRQVAQSLSIDRSTYAYYETGKTHPDFETLTRIARMFGVSTDYLLGLDESPVRSVIRAIPGFEDPRRDMGPERIELARLNEDEQALILLFRQLDEDAKERLFTQAVSAARRTRE
ncbi:MAG: helix-turn-helix transcriptional regulator [Clostridiales bacterium]|nr:helix-turn-helix transcriptional regulator [Clostridiales bacterium]